MYVKFIYFEMASQFCKISTLLLSIRTVDKSKVDILQNYVAFSEYTNFTYGDVETGPSQYLAVKLKPI